MLKSSAEQSLKNKQSQNNLQNVLESRIEQMTKEIDQLYNKKIKLNQLEIELPGINIKPEFITLENLLNFRIIIGIIFLDLSVATLIHLKARFRYEEIYSLRQIIVIINEGYKNLYHFVNNNKNQVKRKNSFWIKDIGYIIENELSEFQPEYTKITIELESFLENLDTVKDVRDLSIHYDKNSIKVYEMMKALNQETVFHSLIKFLNIINKMFDFSRNITQTLESKTQPIIKMGDDLLLNWLNKYRPNLPIPYDIETIKILSFVKLISSLNK